MLPVCILSKLKADGKLEAIWRVDNTNDIRADLNNIACFQIYVALRLAIDRDAGHRTGRYEYRAILRCNDSVLQSRSAIF